MGWWNKKSLMVAAITTIHMNMRVTSIRMIMSTSISTRVINTVILKTATTAGTTTTMNRIDNVYANVQASLFHLNLQFVTYITFPVGLVLQLVLKLCKFTFNLNDDWESRYHIEVVVAELQVFTTDEINQQALDKYIRTDTNSVVYGIVFDSDFGLGKLQLLVVYHMMSVAHGAILT